MFDNFHFLHTILEIKQTFLKFRVMPYNILLIVLYNILLIVFYMIRLVFTIKP